MKVIARILLLAILVVAGAAQAQWANALPPVSADDVAMMKAAAREGMDGKPEGTVNAWSNPETRNSGEVTLVSRFEENGRECRLLYHVVTVVHSSPWERRSKICRDAEGGWELRPLEKPRGK